MMSAGHIAIEPPFGDGCSGFYVRGFEAAKARSSGRRVSTGFEASAKGKPDVVMILSTTACLALSGRAFQTVSRWPGPSVAGGGEGAAGAPALGVKNASMAAVPSPFWRTGRVVENGPDDQDETENGQHEW